MKRRNTLFLLLLPFFCFAAEYEFLTPDTLVIKGSKINPANLISTQYHGERIWKKEDGLLRNKKGNILREPDISYYQYFLLDRPFAPGETRVIGTISVKYDPEKPSNLFKLNQVGNGENQKLKYAYMGTWLGEAGAFPLKQFAGKNFEIRRTADKKTVFTGTLKLRKDDPNYQGAIPFTGEEVLELDYSLFTTPGKYYFYVKGIGRSMDFVIGKESLNEAFYIHARGLYHKRCGIAKTQPFTAWLLLSSC